MELLLPLYNLCARPTGASTSVSAGEISPRSRQDSAELRAGDSLAGKQSLLGGLLRLGSTALPRSSNSSLSLTPTCLICLETLTPEDFEVPMRPYICSHVALLLLPHPASNHSLVLPV